MLVLISTEGLRAEDTLLVFARLRDYYHSIGVTHLLYKAVPLVFNLIRPKRTCTRFTD